MPKLLISDIPALVSRGVSQEDLDELLAKAEARTWFDFATPDPEFPNFSVRESDQLPGRILTGKVEVAKLGSRVQHEVPALYSTSSPNVAPSHRAS